ncbi:MAG: crossover junction endodeoxyribonuclease RuvC [Clostridia bacterium]|nr:crossover junction endodeoxyribonuclease RuvC [Clostridia bacterium]
MPTVLGLDISLNGTGAVILKNDVIQYHHRFEPKSIGIERLIEIEEYVTDLIETNLLDLVVIEGYAFARANQAHQMGEIGGVIRRRLHKLRIPWIEIAPNQVKKFASGKGNCKKDLILMNVYKRWRVEFQSSDEADAFILAKIGTILKGYTESLNQKQSEVIKALKKVV